MFQVARRGYTIYTMRTLAIAISISVAAGRLAAESAHERLTEAAELFQEVMSIPEKAIPQELLQKAACIVIVPGVKKAAFVLGAKYGRGFAVCRKNSGTGWGAPGAVRVEGGSFGFQMGVSSTDVVLLVMNERGMKKLLSSKFTLGADASVAGGPVGRSSAAYTDGMMHAEILSYSRSKGLFAGLSLEGATLRNDLDENEAMYGKRWTNKQILTSGVEPPKDAAELVSGLNKFSMKRS
jgi:SH3 domain-containing YSC84-like protein 1